MNKAYKFRLVPTIAELLKKKITSSSSLSRSIADQGWGMFTTLLAQKASARGKHLTKIGQYQPSTKACSCCGVVKKMTLADRIFTCENKECNDYLKAKDRDINAATNIHFWGLLATKVSLVETNRAGTALINACGDTSTQNVLAIANTSEVSLKQEAHGSLVRG